MGLRCLLGHDFSEPRTERDREVRGDEVITTITEVKECSRCGETRVVSENKEVTSAGRGQSDAGATAARSDRSTDDGTGGTDGAPADATPADATSEEPSVDASTADGTGVDATPDESAIGSDAPADGSAAPGDGTVAGADAGVDEGTDDGVPHDEPGAEDGFDHPTVESSGGADEVPDGEVEEDAEIIDADGDDEQHASEPNAGGRGHGEWPDADANRRGDDPADGGDSGEWPDSDGAPSPAEGEDEDVEFLGDDADPAAEDGAASEARTDVVPDAKRADEPGAAADPAGEDAEFIDGDGPGEWPEQAGEDEGYDAELGGDDDGVSVDGNLTPQVDPEVARQEDVEFIEADADATATEEPAGPADEARGEVGGDASGSEAADAGRSTPTVELQTTADNVDTVYVCPDCGNNERVGASSMRAGDICPECKRGYIEERELR